MRASDLLGRTVRGPAQDEGIVIGLLASQDPPSALRVTAVVVSSRHTGAYLGYQQRDQRGPWALAALVRRLHRHTRVVPWAEVRDQLLSAPPGSS